MLDLYHRLISPSGSDESRSFVYSVPILIPTYFIGIMLFVNL
ncbi:hypothetical protein HMPREF9413_0620 [Paenibacillus sp. HGF7]|nr:hypothetical protein HMPREF9413_0620 [Paenibacillus sp. HGF7]